MILGLTILILAGTCLVLVISAISFFLASKILYPKLFGLEETCKIEMEKGYIREEEYLAWDKQRIVIPSPHGYSMAGLWFPAAGSRKTVILIHGVTYTRYGSIKYLRGFRNCGYNALAIDQRHHGETGGLNSTFGFYERYDMKAWTDWVLALLGSDSIVGTHGESMGAAVALQHAAIDPHLAFVVADCSFSDLRGLLALRIKEDFHLPVFPFLVLSSAISWILSAGMTFGKICPIKAAASMDIPVFFIHGAKDTYIPPEMSRKMYMSREGKTRKLYIAPDAAHAESYVSNPAEYERQIADFLEETGN